MPGLFEGLDVPRFLNPAEYSLKSEQAAQGIGHAFAQGLQAAIQAQGEKDRTAISLKQLGLQAEQQKVLSQMRQMEIDSKAQSLPEFGRAIEQINNSNTPEELVQIPFSSKLTPQHITVLDQARNSRSLLLRSTRENTEFSSIMAGYDKLPTILKPYVIAEYETGGNGDKQWPPTKLSDITPETLTAIGQQSETAAAQVQQDKLALMQATQTAMGERQKAVAEIRADASIERALLIHGNQWHTKLSQPDQALMNSQLKSINDREFMGGLKPDEAERSRRAVNAEFASKLPGVVSDQAPPDPASRVKGKVYQTPKGPAEWEGTGWILK